MIGWGETKLCITILYIKREVLQTLLFQQHNVICFNNGCCYLYHHTTHWSNEHTCDSLEWVSWSWYFVVMVKIFIFRVDESFPKELSGHLIPGKTPTMWNFHPQSSMLYIIWSFPMVALIPFTQNWQWYIIFVGAVVVE